MLGRWRRQRLRPRRREERLDPSARVQLHAGRGRAARARPQPSRPHLRGRERHRHAPHVRRRRPGCQPLGRAVARPPARVGHDRPGRGPAGRPPGRPSSRGPEGRPRRLAGRPEGRRHAELARHAALTRAGLLVAEPETDARDRRDAGVASTRSRRLYFDEAAALLRDQPLHGVDASAPCRAIRPSGSPTRGRPARRASSDTRMRTSGANGSPASTGLARAPTTWCGVLPSRAAPPASGSGSSGLGRAAPRDRRSPGPTFDADERLNLIEQMHVSVLAQTPGGVQVARRPRGHRGSRPARVAPGRVLRRATRPASGSRGGSPRSALCSATAMPRRRQGSCSGNLVGSVADAPAVGVRCAATTSRSSPAVRNSRPVTRGSSPFTAGRPRSSRAMPETRSRRAFRATGI